MACSFANVCFYNRYYVRKTNGDIELIFKIRETITNKSSLEKVLRISTVLFYLNMKMVEKILHFMKIFCL